MDTIYISNPFYHIFIYYLDIFLLPSNSAEIYQTHTGPNSLYTQLEAAAYLPRSPLLFSFIPSENTSNSPADSYLLQYPSSFQLTLLMKTKSVLVLSLLLGLALSAALTTAAPPKHDDNHAAHNGTWNGTAHNESNDAAYNATTFHKLPAANQRTEYNIYSFVDNALKNKYWYYLTKADLLYLTYVAQGNTTYQFLAIYRNIVGTFLAITTWANGAADFQVNTLVRLGDGNAKKIGANYKPIKVQPLELRYNLGPGEVVIDFTDSYDIKVNGKDIAAHQQTGAASNSTEELLVQECKQFSDFARKKFWYYLENADVIYCNVGKTAQRNYCLINYLNIVGTFLLIGSHQTVAGSDGINEVDTLVRLGNGSGQKEGANYTPVNFQKITLPLQDYSA